VERLKKRRHIADATGVIELTVSPGAVGASTEASPAAMPISAGVPAGSGVEAVRAVGRTDPRTSAALSVAEGRGGTVDNAGIGVRVTASRLGT